MSNSSSRKFMRAIALMLVAMLTVVSMPNVGL